MSFFSRQKTLVITDKGIYIIQQREIIRFVKVESIAALTKCVPSSTNVTEIVIHVRQEPDFRVYSDR